MSQTALEALKLNPEEAKVLRKARATPEVQALQEVGVGKYERTYAAGRGHAALDAVMGGDQDGVNENISKQEADDGGTVESDDHHNHLNGGHDHKVWHKLEWVGGPLAIAGVTLGVMYHYLVLGLLTVDGAMTGGLTTIGLSAFAYVMNRVVNWMHQPKKRKTSKRNASPAKGRGRRR